MARAGERLVGFFMIALGVWSMKRARSFHMQGRALAISRQHYEQLERGSQQEGNGLLPGESHSAAMDAAVLSAPSERPDMKVRPHLSRPLLPAAEHLDRADSTPAGVLSSYCL
jgi:hypothetical protein